MTSKRGVVNHRESSRAQLQQSAVTSPLLLYRMISFILLLCRFFTIAICVTDQYVLDDKVGLGRVFDGIGGLSGGGVSWFVLFNFLVRMEFIHSVDL